ncbi:uncharacterized protein LOC143265129 [Megachile rotundata]|uniref:uncharacterized protein LOC143265129 n=1 Tax=Megachile rotundata TaxID=143995 RepID=UPI003FD21D5B
MSVSAGSAVRSSLLLFRALELDARRFRKTKYASCSLQPYPKKCEAAFPKTSRRETNVCSILEGSTWMVKGVPGGTTSELPRQGTTALQNDSQNNAVILSGFLRSRLGSQSQTYRSRA